jgi:uncharacterized protein
MLEEGTEPLRSRESKPVEPWMETLSGSRYEYARPDPAVINIKDIARSLTYLCRYNGHCNRFYSVAEHCIHMANVAPPDLKLLALLHDAHEAYCGDIPSPMKAAMNNLSIGGEWSIFSEVERLAKNATEIALHIDHLWSPERRAAVKALDTRICGDERMAIKDESRHDWGLPAPLGIAADIRNFPWIDFRRTEQTFLEIYHHERVRVPHVKENS